MTRSQLAQVLRGDAPNVLPARGALLGVAFALLAAVGFSAKAVLAKLTYIEGMDAMSLLALRMSFSAPFFVGVALWAKARQFAPLSTRDWIIVVALGLLGYYLSSYLDFLGLEYISAGLERLILFLYPTMTVILSALVYRRAIGRRVIAAMILCYAGIALVFVHNAEVKQDGIVLGASLVFAGTLCFSLYLIGAGHAIARIGAMRFTAYAMLVASAASLLQFALMRPLAALDLPLRAYGLTFAMAILATVLPVFLMSYAIRRIGPSSTSLIGSIGPISTLYLAYVFLDEGVSLLQGVGSALILAGVLSISLSKKGWTAL